MKNKIKRLMAIICCIAICVTTLSGCNPDSGSTTAGEENTTGSAETGNGETNGDKTETDETEEDVMVEVKDQVKLENEHLAVTLSVKNGLEISSIYDKLNNHEYLASSHPLFSYNVTTDLEVGGYNSLGTFNSLYDVKITSAQANEKGTKLVVELDLSYYKGLSVVAVVDTSTDEMTVQITVKNATEKPIYIWLNYPNYSSLLIPGKANEAFAMIPSEVGWVGQYGGNNSYGNGYNDETGLPTGINVMQVAAIYNVNGEGGIYFYDQTGDEMSDTPVSHLQISQKRIQSRWGKEIEANTEAASPVIAMGVIHDNDWHAAVDAFMEHQSDLLENKDGIPEWLLEAGAVYAARREGTGGTYQAVAETGDLNTRIGSFYDMDQLLDEAQDFGTDVVLVVDFYEKAVTEGLDFDLAQKIDSMPYWNKGDYVPREDLGGEEAFIAGIQKVHDRGGKVMVYVEPFIIFEFSQIGRTLGQRWAARLTSGAMDTSYGLCYTMIPAYETWQNYLVNQCVRLVEDYGVDGIFLDSLGWQWNHWYYNQAELDIYSLEEYNQGFIELNNRIREAIREINPEAVVLSESAGGPLPAYNDGGWASQNVWGKTTDIGVIVASPVRYASPTVNFITNGNNLNELNQVFAAGFSLALNDVWDADKDYISELVKIRRDYKDAMVYGQQAYQPETGSTYTVAYYYDGTDNVVIPVVNAVAAAYSGTVQLDAAEAGQVYTDLLTGNKYTVSNDGTIELSIPGKTLVVLQREK